MNTQHCKQPGTFRFISVGDIHFGHPQTPTSHIIANLDRYCVSDAQLQTADMLIITGDVYDRLLHNADENVHRINSWITRLLYRCAAHDVLVRVVEGTPSHDRGQPRFFAEQARNAKIPVDLHYAPTLSIEYIDRFDMHVLYVPDKWRSDTQETLHEVRVLLKQHNLEQVDFAIMHGAFTYQLPEVVTEPTHDPEAYLALVKYLILIGHVHQMSHYQRILAAGSFDRICHGDEGPKGCFDVQVRAPDDYRVTFVENKGAKRYDTLDCRDMDTKSLNVLLRKHLQDLPAGSAIRLRCHNHDAANGDIDHLRKSYPQYEWSVVIDRTKRNKDTVASVFRHADLSGFTPITPDTITKLVQEVLTRQQVDATTQSRCLQRLEGIRTWST